MSDIVNEPASAATEPAAPARPRRRMAREPQQSTSQYVPEEMEAPQQRKTKALIVEDLLRHEGGSTLDELCGATDWQPHTCRAFLTGLRKKGHRLDKAWEAEGVTRWSIIAEDPS